MTAHRRREPAASRPPAPEAGKIPIGLAIPGDDAVAYLIVQVTRGELAS
jgi:hypothetical protein